MSPVSIRTRYNSSKIFKGLYRGVKFAEHEPADDENRSPAKRVAKLDSAEGKIEALAKKLRKPGESVQQSIVRALRLPEGPGLYAKHRAATLRNLDGSILAYLDPAAPVTKAATSAGDELDALATAEQQRNGGSEQQAMAKVLKTRQGRKLYAEHKAQRRAAA